MYHFRPNDRPDDVLRGMNEMHETNVRNAGSYLLHRTCLSFRTLVTPPCSAASKIHFLVSVLFFSCVIIVDIVVADRGMNLCLSESQSSP